MKLNLCAKAILSVTFFITAFPSAIAYRPNIYVSSAGFDDGNSADLQVDGHSAFAQFGKRPTRGLNVAVVDQDSGNFTALRVFDVSGSRSESVSFQNFIDSLPFGSIVLIAVKDEGSRYLDIRSRWVIESLGSRYISQLRFRDSWAMIGHVGASPHSAHEQLRSRHYGSSTVVVPQFSLGQSDENYVDIDLLSAGFQDGNSAGMLINGRSILNASLAGAPTKFSRGLHVTVLDSLFGFPEHFRSFDLHRSKTFNRELQSFLQSLSYAAIVSITVRDEGSRFLDRFSRWLLEGLGSHDVSRLSHRDSWCLVGTVGASSGSAYEAYQRRKSGAAKLRVQMPLWRGFTFSLYIHIRLFSAGFNSGNMAGIQVNGKSVFKSGLEGIPTGPSRGLNVAVVDELTGRFIGFKNFDVFRSPSNNAAFKNFVRGLPHGRIVLITVMDEGSRFLDSEARRLCKGLGSTVVDRIGFRDSWSMIGSVGASAGSATEVLTKRKRGSAEVEEENYPLTNPLPNPLDLF